MKVLITGAKGFLGRHLSQYLIKQGLEITSYDLVDGENLLDYKALCAKVKYVDIVIHLAAVGDVYEAAKDPAGAAIAGVAGTANLIKAINNFTVKKIIYASTWEVYGEPQFQPINENHPCMPDHPYSISKYAGELMIRSKLNKIPWIILRLGSAYGLNMRPHAVIPLFIKKALNKEKIILEGGGLQKRQFIHSDDINNAFYKAATIPVINEVFNIVSTDVMTIRQIALSIQKKIQVEIVLGEKRLGDVPSATVSSEKAKKLLHWTASKLFKSGIQEIINEIKSKK